LPTSQLPTIHSQSLVSHWDSFQSATCLPHLVGEYKYSCTHESSRSSIHRRSDLRRALLVGTGVGTKVSAPAATPQVRAELTEEQLAAPPDQDAASRAIAKEDQARREAQAQEEQRSVLETRSRGFWIDPTSKLMWEGRDNGIAVTWHKAASYCRDLRLAGYSDWRLATLDELASPVDQKATCTDQVGHKETCLINIGNLPPRVRLVIDRQSMEQQSGD
jgi:hypothetical protein